MDRLAVGEAEHDDAVGHEVTFVHLGVAATGQILAAVSLDEIADVRSVGPEGLRVMDVEVDYEIGAHRSDSTGTRAKGLKLQAMPAAAPEVVLELR